MLVETDRRARECAIDVCSFHGDVSAPPPHCSHLHTLQHHSNPKPLSLSQWYVNKLINLINVVFLTSRFDGINSLLKVPCIGWQCWWYYSNITLHKAVVAVFYCGSNTCKRIKTFHSVWLKCYSVYKSLVRSGTSWYPSFALILDTCILSRFLLMTPSLPLLLWVPSWSSIA